MGEISVIIVSWNACGYLSDCLTSIRHTGGSAIREVIVIDNDSSDGSPEMVRANFPEVRLIRSGDNLGFAKANNLGMRHATGPLLAFINSDVIVHPRCFEKLSSLLENEPAVGLVGPKIQGRDGSLQLTCGRLPTAWNTLCQFMLLDKVFHRWPLFSGFKMRPEDHKQRRETEFIGGCFWLARKSAIDVVGELDEKFFFYAEDIDWCKRFKDAGWKIMFLPEATATHFGGGSSSNAPLRYYIEIMQANLTYYRKHHGHIGRMSYYVLALLQHSIRLTARLFLKITGLARDDVNKHIQEHIVCLRWLLTGRTV